VISLGEYKPRIVDNLLKRYLDVFGAVEIVGCRWCGKTWTALAHGNSVIKLDDAQTRSLIEADPDLAFEGEPPHVIDEWQVVLSLWDNTRRKVDDAGSKKGLFILTGSSTPNKGQVSHSGAGRIARLKMRPMSLSEVGASDASVSLAGLFNGEFTKGAVQTDLRRIAAYICSGGWPGLLNISHEEDIGLIPSQYIEALITSDAQRKGLNEQTLRKLLRSLARNIGSSVTMETLMKDMSLEDGDIHVKTGTRTTISKYLKFLADHYIIEDLNGWDAPIKSRSRLRSKPKRSFVDPSIPAVLLGTDSERLLGEMQMFGQLFEELCLRDLRIYSSSLSAVRANDLCYYRDSDGLEVDAIIELMDGRWAAFEIKLSQAKVDEGVKNLIRLRNKVLSNPAAMNREPAFLAVLVGKADFKYQTPEGVYVIPVTSLGA